jgi:uncharacterized membrane protein
MRSFGNRLDEETREWVEQGIITEEQREEIVSQYEGEDSSRGIRAVLLLGAVMVGLGALLFVGANWSAIPVAGRMAILVGLTTAAYYSGWNVKYEREGWNKVGDAVLLIGSVLVGATLFLTAQTFNIEANVHWLLLLWLVAVAPVSYAVNSKPTLLLSVVLLGWWSGSYVGGGSLFDVAEGFFTNIGAYAFYGITLYGVGRIHEGTRFDDFASTYKTFGPVFFFAMTYAVAVSELAVVWEIEGLEGSAFLFLMFLTALTTAGVNVYLGKLDEKVEAAWYAGAFALSLLTVGISWILVETELIGETDELLVNALTVLYHAAFLALVVGIVYMGYTKRATAYVNIGLLFFVLYTGYLYVAKIATYLGTSLAFVLGGLILLVGGVYLEKKRREIVEDIGGDASWT